MLPWEIDDDDPALAAACTDAAVKGCCRGEGELRGLPGASVAVGCQQHGSSAPPPRQALD